MGEGREIGEARRTSPNLIGSRWPRAAPEPAWSEQAKALAQQSLNAGLQAAQNSTALLLEEAARLNAAAVRKAFEEGAVWMEETIAASRRIAWLSLAASAIAFTAAVCAVFIHV